LCPQLERTENSLVQQGFSAAIEFAGSIHLLWRDEKTLVIRRHELATFVGHQRLIWELDTVFTTPHLALKEVYYDQFARHPLLPHRRVQPR